MVGTIWKDIKEYENYQVNNLGEVRKIYKSGKMKILKPIETKNGYLRVRLSKNGNIKNKFIHRLVAETFFGESNLSVNHKDENKRNNNIDNLEFMTLRKNIQYSKCKKITQHNLSGELIKEWKSSAEVERCLMIPNSDVTACCRNKRKTAGGYTWRYANDR